MSSPDGGPEAQVREAAAIAIAHHGDPAGAGLLQLKARVGDPEPAVILACLGGLISLVPGWGVAKAALHLHGQDGDLHEVAALALGQSRREDALDELLSALSSEALPQRRSVLLRVLGLHRSDRAVEALLRVIATGDEVDAQLAVDSLSVRDRAASPASAAVSGDGRAYAASGVMGMPSSSSGSRAKYPHADRFVLKGALLVAVWAPEVFRATRDLDLLGRGDVSPQELAVVFLHAANPYVTY